MAQFHVYSQTVADGTATSVVRPSDWNSAHVQQVTISGNTAGQSTASGTNLVFQGGNNVTLSLATAANVATLVVSASQSNQAFSAAGGSSAFQTLGFSDGGGISFTNTNGSVGATVRTDYASSAHGHTLTVSAQSNTTQSSSGTLNMAGLNVQGAGIVSVGVSNNSLVVSGTQSNQAFSAAGGSSAFQTLGFSDTNGVSFSNSNGSVVATVRTDYASSNHGHTITVSAQSNTTQASSGTLNMAGLNVQGAGIVSVGVSNNSLVISATGGGGGVTPVASASNGSFSFTTLAFSNANNVTFGTSAGGIITASVAPPGAAAENNAINLLGANTAGNTTATGSTIGWSGVNVTLSGTNASQVVISAPATSSLVGASGISLSSNGSTITIYDSPAISFWPPIPLPIGSSSLNSGTSGATGGSFQTTASLYISPMQIEAALTFGEVELVVSHGALSAGTGSGSILHALGIYTLNAGTALSLVSSFEFNARLSVNSATAVSAHFYWGTNSTSNSTSIGGNVSASVTGVRQLKLYDSTGQLSAGDYWVAHAYTARSSSVNVLTSFATGMYLSNSQTNLVLNYFGNNTTAPTQRHIGIVSTTQNNANSLVFQMPSSINTTAITNTGGSSQHRYNVPRIYV